MSCLLCAVEQTKHSQPLFLSLSLHTHTHLIHPSISIQNTHITSRHTAETPRLWGELKAMCQEGLQEERIGHGPWYRRGEEPWLGIVTGVMARFLRRAPEALAAAEVSGRVSSHD